MQALRVAQYAAGRGLQGAQRGPGVKEPLCASAVLGAPLTRASCHLLERLYATDGASGAGDSRGNDSFGSRLWAHIRNLSRGRANGEGASGTSGESHLVASSPESRFREVLAVALTRRPIFPGGLMPINITGEKLVAELMQLKKAGGQAYVGAFMKSGSSNSGGSNKGKDPAGLSSLIASEDENDFEGENDERPAVDATTEIMNLNLVGTFCQVHSIAPTDKGAQLLLLGHRRLRIVNQVGEAPLRFAVQHLKDEEYDSQDDRLKATVMEVVSTLKELLHLHPLYNEQLKMFASFGGDFTDVSRLMDMGASVTSASDKLLQAVLEELSIPKRAAVVLELLKKEVDICKLQANIGKQVEEKISKDQRRYFLQEQLRSIKKELGLEKDDKSVFIQKFQQRLEKLGGGVPEEAQRVIDEELAKLKTLDPSSSEFQVTRNYLDWLTNIPWGVYSDEKLDIMHAQTVLDEDHYGLKDVKDRILEFIAVGRLRGSTQGKILCLVGPPGVGKTSIGRSIARALDRKYYRFSVGGLSDVAEIKGHRRTYVGAMPGKIIQCLKITETSNPLVLIDEIDKLGRGHQGDPASALLELLDPEQNSGFLDHFLDTPVDLTKVLFMCTANNKHTIPQPLQDRMEIIDLSGYIASEKEAIARRYLEPQARKDAGVPEGTITITDAAMLELVTEYSREPGVRSLKKLLEKIYRKSALKLVRSESERTKASEPAGEGTAEEQPASQPASLVAALQKAVSGITSKASAPAEDRLSGADRNQDLPAIETASPANSEPGREVDLGALSGKDEGQDRAVELESQTGPKPDDTDGLGWLGGGAKRSAAKKGSQGDNPSAATDDASRRADVALDGTSDDDGDIIAAAAAASTKPAMVVAPEDRVTIDVDDLQDYVGQRPFPKDRMYPSTPAGVVMGLAANSMGGSVLYVEAAVVEKAEGKGNLKLTGQLGDVMKESAQIAHTFSRSFLLKNFPDSAKYFQDNAIHMHVPEGATPKDGPSGGCAIITSLLSLALGRPVLPDLAMTGEVTLLGRVLPIGGVKEKTLAARRSGVSTLIFPAANKKDWDELGEEVKEGLNPHFAEWYDDVYNLAFDYDGAKPAGALPTSEQGLQEHGSHAPPAPETPPPKAPTPEITPQATRT